MLSASAAGTNRIQRHTRDRWKGNPAVSGAADDPGLLDVANRVLALVGAQGAAAGKHNVSVCGSHGVQIGTYSTQANLFNSSPSREGTER
jgi:hypothetical protein